MQKAASLNILPPGTLPTQKLDGDNFTLKVNRVATTNLEIPESEVIYPDGFIKWHQAAEVDDLMKKIEGTLLGRYGINGYTVGAGLAAVEPGEIVITNVTFKS